MITRIECCFEFFLLLLYDLLLRRHFSFKWEFVNVDVFKSLVRCFILFSWHKLSKFYYFPFLLFVWLCHALYVLWVYSELLFMNNLFLLLFLWMNLVGLSYLQIDFFDLRSIYLNLYMRINLLSFLDMRLLHYFCILIANMLLNLDLMYFLFLGLKFITILLIYLHFVLDR